MDRKPGVGSRESERDGEATRRRIQEVALRRFTEHGFEATSIRDIADELGLTKSALYYHFRSKDEIATSLFASRREEIDELIAWIAEQPPSADLLRRAAHRWLDHVTPQQILGMRFAHANTPVITRLTAANPDLRAGFDELTSTFLSAHASMTDRLYVRMVFDTLSAALSAAEGTDATDDEIVAAARRAITSLTSSGA